MKTAVCVFVRDEQRDFAEWLAYQFAVGFDAVIVYNNGSVDKTPDIARRFAAFHSVIVTNWPDTAPEAQPVAYSCCLSRFQTWFDWIAFIDSDELIVPRTGNIRDLLGRHEDSAGVALNWAMFGSSGHGTRPPGLMIDTFRRRAKSDFDKCRVIKPIVRPGKVVRGIGDCFFEVDGKWSTPSGEPVRWTEVGQTDQADHSVAQVNHYFTRSRAEWHRKLVQGHRKERDETAMRSIGKFGKFDRNEILDLGVTRFADAVRKTLWATGTDDFAGLNR